MKLLTYLHQKQTLRFTNIHFMHSKSVMLLQKIVTKIVQFHNCISLF